MNDSEIIEKNSSKAIKRGALMSYIVVFVNIIATLFYTPWMIKEIGSNNYGLYTLALSIITFFLVDFGINSALTRFISKYRAEGKPEKANELVGAALKIYLLFDLLAVIILLIVFANLSSIYIKLNPTELDDFKTIYLLVSFYCILVFPFNSLDGVLRSYEIFFQLKLCELASKILSIGFIIAALLNGYGLYSLVIANILTGIFGVVLKLIFMFKYTPIRIKWVDVDKKIYKEILNFSFWVAIISIAQRFIFNITPTILGMFSGAVSIAVFGIAGSLEGYFYTVANAINGMFLPKISRMVKKDNFTENLLSLMIRVGRIQLIIISYFFITFCLVGKDFILLWLGKEYISAYYCAIFLILPSLLYLPQQIANTAIVAINMVNLQARVFVAMAVSNLIISIICSNYYGALGASIAICIAYLIRCLGMNFIYHKHLMINLKKFFIECYLKLSISIIITAILCSGINLLIIHISWINLIAKSFIIFVLYWVIIWHMALNTMEKKFIRNGLGDHI